MTKQNGGFKMKYNEFIASKTVEPLKEGFDVKQVNEQLYDFQVDIVKWALKSGRAAIWADCGLGKTPMQLEWAKYISKKTGGDVLILAPLAVTTQTKNEGLKFGVDVTVCESHEDVGQGINITNYEKIQKFDLCKFSGIVLDESSILKNYAGKFRNEIIDKTRDIQYKLACTATPAPNDYEEIGNHAEFLGVMKRKEMLSMFFVHDSGNTSKWRLKGHAESKFWEWLTSWAVMIRKPSDLGYDDRDFILPELKVHEIVVKAAKKQDGYLFAMEARTMSERRDARKNSIEERCQLVADMINYKTCQSWDEDEHALVWCDRNDESTLLHKLIPFSVEVTGSQTNEKKIEGMNAFTRGQPPVLISKPSICGFGMNWQHCNKVFFTGLSDSYEQYYQAVRRCWRFGQKKPVNVYIVISEQEGAVLKNIQRKERDSEKMFAEMVSHMKDLSIKKIKTKTEEKTMINDNLVIQGHNYVLYRGDCIDKIKLLQDNSVHYSVFSPPFAELYTYSDSDRDMGNSKNYDQFFQHFSYLVSELYRVIKPGRLVSFHCMDIPAMKERDGYIGLKDFPADLIKCFEKFGWIYHGKHIIWKDPLIEATRTKALGLMHKQLCKDSAMARAGLPDYLITMRKPGTNEVPISHPNGLSHYAGKNNIAVLRQPQRSHNIWRAYASPVWMDIRQTKTLNRQPARSVRDEKHICPLQLDVIERALTIYSNEGDVILTPFAGIGSEAYMAVKMNRTAIAIELKKSYFDCIEPNIKQAKHESGQLF